MKRVIRTNNRRECSFSGDTTITVSLQVNYNIVPLSIYLTDLRKILNLFYWIIRQV